MGSASENVEFMCHKLAELVTQTLEERTSATGEKAGTKQTDRDGMQAARPPNC